MKLVTSCERPKGSLFNRYYADAKSGNLLNSSRISVAKNAYVSMVPECQI